MSLPKLITISGPTAVGKTSFAIELAEKLDAEIISYDSRQIYKEMNIGVARPTEEELSRVKHHFIASHSIHDRFTVKDYEIQARKIFYELTENKKHVVAVGGTGLYIRALINGLDEMPDIDEGVREKLNAKYLEKGIKHIKERAKKIDEKSYFSIDSKNARRLIRIIEIWETSGKKLSDLQLNRSTKLEANVKNIVLERPREVVYDRINLRVDMMVDEGLENEVKSLNKYRDLKALNTLGYKQFFQYFDGEISKDTCIEKIKQHSRNYAKRQITWNKKYINNPIIISEENINTTFGVDADILKLLQ